VLFLFSFLERKHLKHQLLYPKKIQALNLIAEESAFAKKLNDFLSF
jgi:hypothetical protein